MELEFPAWATQIAIDASGDIYAYEHTPFWDGENWMPYNDESLWERIGDYLGFIAPENASRMRFILAAPAEDTRERT